MQRTVLLGFVLIVKSFNPFWSQLPQITQLYGLCCVEETTTKLVYCDGFFRITSVTIQFLLLGRGWLGVWGRGGEGGGGGLDATTKH